MPGNCGLNQTKDKILLAIVLRFNRIFSQPDYCFAGIAALLVYDADKEDYSNFLTGALSQTLVNQTFEFRVLTRTKQLRWFMMNVRGVYNKIGKYLGIRASVIDISRLKSAMGHIFELERTKEFDSRNKQRLQTELELKTASWFLFCCSCLRKMSC